ncbi:MAG: hypothetical protein IT310_13670 [Anaerolineales bacterium]|nr:hypothetical protein [Anaerolineales bacterium]
MSHTVTYNATLHILEVEVRGQLSLGEAKELIAEIVRTGVENDCFLCLSDYRQMSLNLSTLQIYDVPNIIADTSSQLGVPAQRFKRAIVVAKDLEDFRFYETVTVNNGHNVRMFQDFDEARTWLLEK